MVLHELVTNAAKYGALSTKKGRISIRWARRPDGHLRSNLVLEWQEFGGPRVVAHGKPSYGTSVTLSPTSSAVPFTSRLPRGGSVPTGTSG